MKRFALLLLALLPLPALSAEEVQGLIYAEKLVHIPGPVLQEIIEEVKVKEGDTVQEGQVVVELRNAKEFLAVQEAQKIVENAEFVARGTKSLFDQKMGSKEVYLKAQTEQELAGIRHSIAEEQLREKTIRSKISGIVVKIYKEAGEAVDRGEKLVDVVNLDQVKGWFYLSPRFFSTLQLNDAVAVGIPDLGLTKVPGRIEFIAPIVDPSSGLVLVKVLIDNKDHKIKAGLKAVVDFSKKP